MSKIKRAFRNPAILAAIAALALYGTAGAQADPENVDPLDGAPLLRMKMEDTPPQSRANLPPSRVYKCDYKFEDGRMGQQVTGLYRVGNSLNGWYSAIFPDGRAAETNEFQLTWVGTDGSNVHWDYVGKGGETRCRLWVDLFSDKRVGFYSCNNDLSWMRCAAIF